MTTPVHGDLYVSPAGRDEWSGTESEPATDGTDGPFATIQRAIDEAAASGDDALPAPVTICLRGGRYELAEPLEIGPEVARSLTLARYPGERPVVSGGREIDGWEETMVGGTSAWVADVPAVARGEWDFRQMFVNGERRPRPRLPKEGYFRIADCPEVDLDEVYPWYGDAHGRGTDAFVAAPGDLGEWSRPEDVDAVVHHYWHEQRLPVESIDPSSGRVTCATPSEVWLVDDPADRFARYYVENVFEALTEPGEWYLDRDAGRVYYLPRPDEEPETTTVVAPRIPRLLSVRGDPATGAFVESVHVRGITVRHTTWERPGPDVPTGGFGALHVPGAIGIRGVRGLWLEDCTIESIGGHAVEVGEGSRGVRISRCEMADLGAGGVVARGGDADAPPETRIGDLAIEDCDVHDGGRVFPSGPGILLSHVFDAAVVHNHIHDLRYSGIVLDGGLTYEPGVARDVLVARNHLHDLGGSELNDLGGVHTTGVQPGTVVRENIVHGVSAADYGGWGIYADEATTCVRFEGNVVSDVSSQPFHQHSGRENVVRDNVLAFGDRGQVRLTGVEDHVSFRFERNLVVTDDRPLFVGGGWSWNRPRHTYDRTGLEHGGIDADSNRYLDVKGASLWCANVGLDDRWTRRFTFPEWCRLVDDHRSTVENPDVIDGAVRSPDSLDALFSVVGPVVPSHDQVGPREGVGAINRS